MTTTTHGRGHILATFQQAQAEQRSALMPYFTIGFPDLETSLDVIEAIAPHSDLLELGVPFSDPIADGTTIQHSTQVALDSGTTTKKCLTAVKSLRDKGIETPAMLMGYYNPILAYGQENYVRDAAEAGVDGFIVPDLPPEEADELEALAEKYGLAFIHFLAPTSSPERIEAVAARANGFIYMVSLTGITGARTEIAADLGAFIGRVRAQTEAPLAVGFGISTPEQAAKVGSMADGVIVGSALIKTVENAPAGEEASAASTFVQSLREAMQNE